MKFIRENKTWMSILLFMFLLVASFFLTRMYFVSADDKDNGLIGTGSFAKMAETNVFAINYAHSPGNEDDIELCGLDKNINTVGGFIGFGFVGDGSDKTVQLSVTSPNSKDVVDYAYDNIEKISDQAKNYAYYGRLLQATGVDQTLANGFGNGMRSVVGLVVLALFVIVEFLNAFWNFALDIVKYANPFYLLSGNFAGVYATSGGATTSGFDGVLSAIGEIRQAIGSFYSQLESASKTVFLPLFVITSLFMWLVVNKGQHGISTLKNTFIRVLFVAVGVVLLSSVYTTAVGFVKSMGEGNNAGATKAVLATFVDFESIVYDKGLIIDESGYELSSAASQIEKGVVKDSVMNAVRNVALKSNGADGDAKIGSHGIGDFDQKIAKEWVKSLSGSGSDDGSKDKVISLLERYASGAKVTSGGFESRVKSSTLGDKGFTDPKVQKEYILSESWNFFSKTHCKERTYNIVNGASVKLPAEPPTDRGSYAIWKQYNGGMSVMSIYNYLSSVFDASKVSVYSAQTGADLAKAQHYSVNVVGSTVMQWVLIADLVCMLLAMSVVGYAYSLGLILANFKAMLHIVPSVLIGTLGSLRGIASTVILVAALMIEVIGTALIYNVGVMIVGSLYDLIAFPVADILSSAFEGLGGGLFVVVTGALSCVLMLFFMKSMITYRSAICMSVSDMATKAINKFLGTDVSNPGLSNELNTVTAVVGSAAMIGVGVANQAGVLNADSIESTASNLGERLGISGSGNSESSSSETSSSSISSLTGSGGTGDSADSTTGLADDSTMAKEERDSSKQTKEEFDNNFTADSTKPSDNSGIYARMDDNGGQATWQLKDKDGNDVTYGNYDAAKAAAGEYHYEDESGNTKSFKTGSSVTAYSAVDEDGVYDVNVDNASGALSVTKGDKTYDMVDSNGQTVTADTFDASQASSYKYVNRASGEELSMQTGVASARMVEAVSSDYLADDNAQFIAIESDGSTLAVESGDNGQLFVKKNGKSYAMVDGDGNAVTVDNYDAGAAGQYSYDDGSGALTPLHNVKPNANYISGDTNADYIMSDANNNKYLVHKNSDGSLSVTDPSGSRSYSVVAGNDYDQQITGSLDSNGSYAIIDNSTGVATGISAVSDISSTGSVTGSISELNNAIVAKSELSGNTDIIVASSGGSALNVVSASTGDAYTMGNSASGDTLQIRTSDGSIYHDASGYSYNAVSPEMIQKDSAGNMYIQLEGSQDRISLGTVSAGAMGSSTSVINNYSDVVKIDNAAITNNSFVGDISSYAGGGYGGYGGGLSYGNSGGYSGSSGAGNTYVFANGGTASYDSIATYSMPSTSSVPVSTNSAPIVTETIASTSTIIMESAPAAGLVPISESVTTIMPSVPTVADTNLYTMVASGGSLSSDPALALGLVSNTVHNCSTTITAKDGSTTAVSGENASPEVLQEFFTTEIEPSLNVTDANGKSSTFGVGDKGEPLIDADAFKTFVANRWNAYCVKKDARQWAKDSKTLANASKRINAAKK